MASKGKRVYPIQSDYMERYEIEQNRHKRRKRGLIRRLITTGIIMLFLTILVTQYHLNQRTVYSEKIEQYEALQTEMTQLEKTENELLEEIDLLSDEAYILDIARTNYFLTKEGELIFQLQDFSSSY